MGTYSTKKILKAHSSQIDSMAEAIKEDFQLNGFEVKIDTLMSGGKDISITKGNLFKAVLGMRSALKISLIPQTNGVLFEANVGIFGQQAIPTVISMLFFWPVLITQIWGLVEQSKLDDRALALAEQAIAEGAAQRASYFSSTSSSSCKYCPNCGKQIDNSSKFCPYCGAKLE